MTVLRIDHVSVTTADLERSIAFYRDVLGLKLLRVGESDEPEMSTITGLPGVRLLWAELDLGGGQSLELLQYLAPEGTPVAQRSCDPGSAHIAFAVDDIEELHGRLVSAGAQVRSEPVEIHDDGDWNGVRCLYLTDPDGATIELVERPRDRRRVVIPQLEATEAGAP